MMGIFFYLKSIDIIYYVMYSIMCTEVYDGYSIKKRFLRNTGLGISEK